MRKIVLSGVSDRRQLFHSSQLPPTEAKRAVGRSEQSAEWTSGPTRFVVTEDADDDDDEKEEESDLLPDAVTERP